MLQIWYRPQDRDVTGSFLEMKFGFDNNTEEAEVVADGLSDPKTTQPVSCWLDLSVENRLKEREVSEAFQGTFKACLTSFLSKAAIELEDSTIGHIRPNCRLCTTF